jgi:hypothetical protein
MENYLAWKRACPEAMKIARNLYEEWGRTDPKATFDGMSLKDVERLRKYTRTVWGWSTPRRLCIARATDDEGFVSCEKCKKRVPRIFVDHIKQVGDMDDGYLRRLFCPSTGLQALCKSCHAKKTKGEREAGYLRRKKERMKDF